MYHTYTEFDALRRQAWQRIGRGINPQLNLNKVQRASRYMSNTCSKREVELALAWAVRVEAKVCPEKVSQEDLDAAIRCIGSNGKYPMPMWDWQRLG